MKVSVIVPCYKVETYLPTCIKSVINQSYANWELILIDDGSPDHSGKICDEYAKGDDRIKVIHKPNGGLSDARNAGLEVVTGDFITFLDSDDFWHHDYLKIMMDLQLHYDADIVQCKWTRGNQTSFPEITITHDAVCKSGPKAMASGLFDVMMWGKIYRKNILDGIKMPIGLINEDDWTSWKICYRAKRFVSSRNKLYYYTFNQQGICATTSRVLNLGFFGAFEEKNNFFKIHGDEACTVWNLAKWNKAIILAYHTPNATNEQLDMMMLQFKKNYKELCSFSTFSAKLRLYFRCFMLCPMLMSNMSEGIRNFKRDGKLIRYKK